MKIATRSIAAAAAVMLGVTSMFGAQLSGDARSSIPNDIQQIIVVDYRAMQNSPAAMSLRERVVPPELKRLETALKQSGFKVESVTDVLAFAAFRTKPGSTETHTIGIAQGQFPTNTILGTMTKNKVKATVVRNNSIYPMGASGMSVAFLNQTTMIFGDTASVRVALDTRDGMLPNFLSNSDMMNEMVAVDKSALWSLLDQKGTQVMMRNVLGEAAQLADYDTVKNRMKSSRYTMDFSNGVRFDMAVVMGDTITAATAATLMKGMVLMRKSTEAASAAEKDALSHTTIDSNSGTLMVDYSASDSSFASLLSSPLFLQVVH